MSVSASARGLVTVKASRLPVALAVAVTRTAPIRPFRSSLPLAASVPTLATLMSARSAAVFCGPASRRSGSASTGANFSASAMTPLRSRASRSTAMLPPGEPCGFDPALGLDPGVTEVGDRQPLDRRCRSASSVTRAATFRASTAGDPRAVDLDRQRDLARRLQPNPRQRRNAEADRGIDVELGQRADRRRGAPDGRRPARYRTTLPSTAPRSNSVCSRSTAMRSAAERDVAARRATA